MHGSQKVYKPSKNGKNSVHHSLIPILLQLLPGSVFFNLNTMRFTTILIVTLSAATSGFALTKKGGDGQHFATSLFALPSVLMPALK